MTFAAKLREMRDAKGLSEAKLAELCGLPFGTIHGYGLSLRKPSFAAVVKIAKALGVTCEAFSECDDILGDDAEPAKPARKRRGKK